jgi:hypothetical protein
VEKRQRCTVRPMVSSGPFHTCVRTKRSTNITKSSRTSYSFPTTAISQDTIGRFSQRINLRSRISGRFGSMSLVSKDSLSWKRRVLNNCLVHGSTLYWVRPLAHFRYILRLMRASRRLVIDVLVWVPAEGRKHRECTHDRTTCEEESIRDPQGIPSTSLLVGGRAVGHQDPRAVQASRGASR